MNGQATKIKHEIQLPLVGLATVQDPLLFCSYFQQVYLALVVISYKQQLNIHECIQLHIEQNI